jgi:hypothetical protein
VTGEKKYRSVHTFEKSGSMYGFFLNDKVSVKFVRHTLFWMRIGHNILKSWSYMFIYRAWMFFVMIYPAAFFCRLWEISRKIIRNTFDLIKEGEYNMHKRKPDDVKRSQKRRLTMVTHKQGQVWGMCFLSNLLLPALCFGLTTIIQT